MNEFNVAVASGNSNGSSMGGQAVTMTGSATVQETDFANMAGAGDSSTNLMAKSDEIDWPVSEKSAASATTTTTTTTTTITKSTDISNKSTSSISFPTAVHYFANFHHICVISALLPLLTLLTCFITAYIFQYDDVHETHCRVYNIIPSISAITGIHPQIYFWRCSIAIHIGPRIPIAFVYKNYYRSLLEPIRERSPHLVAKYSRMINVIMVLNCIEVASLGGVTYISNRENYPIHERIFITFMICSLFHMLLTIRLSDVLFADITDKLNRKQRLSLKWKKNLFAISILSTIGLLIFFVKHRFYCHELAFSWFAGFEYVIAIANMLFHFTIVWDFPAQFMLIVQGTEENIKARFDKAKKLD